jgi:hypothetical protein
MARKPLPVQTAAATSGRPGTTRSSMGQPEPGSPASRRSACTDFRPERETQSSKDRRWARKKDAAEGSRIGHRRREEGHNPRRPVDFEAHEPRRANGKSPMVERQTSVNRSPCGRRTSLGAARFNAWPHARLSARRLAASILGPCRRFHAYSCRNMSRRITILQS